MLTVTLILADQNKDKKKTGGYADGNAQTRSGVKKIRFFVGNWMADVTMYPNEFMPGGKSKGKESMKWELDGMFVSMDYQDQPGEEKKMPAYKGKGFMTYDMQKKTYRSWWMDNWGSASESVGDWPDDKTLVLSHQGEFMGKKFQEKFVYQILDQNKFHFQIEHSPDGKEFKKVMEATYTREK